MSGFDRISLRMHIHTIYIYAYVTVLFTQELSFLLLYYLYCLCKSVQRSLLQCACRSESESGCKGKEFFVYPPNFSGSFFFDGLFWRGSRRLASRAPLSPSCHSGAASFPKAGAKVAGLGITAKYMHNFFHTFLKVFPKWLVIRYVLQHVFFTGYIWEVGYTPYYIY